MALTENEVLELIEQAAADGRTTLSLTGRGLTSLPAEIVQLTALTSLDLSANDLELLPAEITKLTALTSLNLRYNDLESLSAEITKLTNLTSLDLSHNGLQSLPAEITKLTALTSLDLSGNGLKSLPAEIVELTNLTSLNLRRNGLQSLPAEITKLTALTSLDLGANGLKSLPAEITKLTSLTSLDLRYNPLKSPPLEVARQGMEAIRNYFAEIEKAQEAGLEAEVRLYEAKLLIVGDGDVGKTWLRHRLIYDAVPDRGTTPGIDIEEWTISTDRTDSFRVNFWDFGGQEIYHSTHQFFLTRRSLYLFVWDARKDCDLGFDYWLNVIELLSDRAPVLVVMNKADERSKGLDEKSIRKRFGNVVEFFRVSAKDGDGCCRLRKRICKEIGKLPQIGDLLPKVWVDVRARLEGLDENYITFERYKEICREFDLDSPRAEHLSRYYHDLGVFLYFESPPVLRAVVFLRPEWATNAVYRLLDTPEIVKAGGVFRFGQLRKIWHDYPEDKYAALLELMKKFELCFELEGRKEYIVPELLAAERPQLDWEYDNNLRFEYHYEFMPAGVLTRFIARMHHRHKGRLFWRTGVVLEWEGTDAMVVADRISKRVQIWIRGRDPREMLAVIREQIDHIHETLNRPAVEEMLPCICDECRQSPEPYFHNFADLKTASWKGKTESQCKKSFDNVLISDLLKPYGMEAEVMQERRDEDEYIPDAPSPPKAPEVKVSGKDLWIIGGFLVFAFVTVMGSITLASKYGGGFWPFMAAVIATFAVIAVLAVIGRFMGVFGEGFVAATIDKALQALGLGLSHRPKDRDMTDD